MCPPAFCRISLTTSVVMALHCPKTGSTSSQSDDAVGWSMSEAAQTTHLAIADGVTAAMFSRMWAQILVDRSVKISPYGFPIARSWLSAARREFYSRINYDGMSWFAAEKLKYGSQATLLTVRIDHRKRRFTVVSIGDCCLAVLGRDTGKTDILPPSLSCPNAFGTRPDVVGTLFGPTSGQVFRSVQSYASPTTFLLMSDALAEWFLNYHRVSPERAWKVMSDLRTVDDLRRLVEFMRLRRLMTDDDVSLVRLTI